MAKDQPRTSAPTISNYQLKKKKKTEIVNIELIKKLQGLLCGVFIETKKDIQRFFYVYSLMIY
jgi:hypothetical protein